MKKIFLLQTLFVSCITVGFGQTVSTDKNAIIQSKLRIATTNEVDATDPTKAVINVGYLDGLGRPLQTVGYQQSPTQKDMVSGAVVYDAFSRVIKMGLLAPATTQSGTFQTNPLGLANAFYADANAYNETTVFDNSPLNRPREQFGAGAAWRNNDRKNQIFDELAGTDVVLYLLNSANDLIYSGNYPANSLYKKRIIDEQGHTNIEITDKSGRVIQKQQQDDIGYITTYYVYDDWGRLRAVLQPEGYKQIVSNGGNANIPYNSTAFNDWVFFYNYDYRGRLIESKVPSAGWEYIVYDKRENPVLMQTALQRNNGSSKWKFIKYDNFGRVIITGELTNNQSRNDLQTLFDNVGVPYETWQGFNYSTVSFPISYNGTDEKLWNFYDQYDWVASQWAFNSSIAYNGSSYNANVEGLQTGSFVRSTEDVNKVFHSVIHYDNKGRVLQTYQIHHKGGANAVENPIISNYEYNFAGEVTKEKVLYQIDGLTNNEVITTSEYDYVGRIKKVFHGINTTPTEIVRFSYDEASRLQQKKILPNGTYTVGGALDYINRPPNPTPNTTDLARKAIFLNTGTVIDANGITKYIGQIDPNAPQGIPIIGLQTLDYQYHLRGGLRGINLDNADNPTPKESEGDLFSYKLDYETAGYYDGNIGKQSWQTTESNAPNGIRSYTLNYDASNRLKQANYTGANSENYSLPNMSYDKNGNITNLQRNGKTSSSFGTIDNLTYNYSGNTLSSVTDAITTNNTVDLVPRGGGAYTYYADGSLRSDANEQISNIVYDSFLKQPTEIQLTDGRWIKHYYDGSGRLFKTVYSTGEIWDFIGSMILKNGAFYQLAAPESRAFYLSGAHGNTSFFIWIIWAIPE